MSPHRSAHQTGQDQGHHHGDHTADAGVGALLDRPRSYDLSLSAFLLGRGSRLRQQLADLIDLRAGQQVLDVGSGTGTLALALAKVCGPSGAVTGVDPSPPMAAAAQAKAARVKGVRAKRFRVKEDAGRSPTRFVVAAAQQLPFPDGCYDAVVSSLVLHHVPEEVRPAALAEMLRVLRPGGHLLIADMQPPAGRPSRRLAHGPFRHELDQGHLDSLQELTVAAGAVEVHRHRAVVDWLGLIHGRTPARAG
jgi:ubiquinone/menaquinone biosynthesis C-methylase UbiE